MATKERGVIQTNRRSFTTRKFPPFPGRISRNEKSSSCGRYYVTLLKVISFKATGAHPWENSQLIAPEEVVSYFFVHDEVLSNFPAPLPLSFFKKWTV